MPSKWEYLCAEIASITGFTVEYKVKHLNMEDIEDWKTGPTPQEYFNQLGEQGWEMVSAPEQFVGLVWFKRPR